uniref:Uncharacterized protein n=1 Tax=Trichobilharzia regenti TaxID=157069 RepID=A0AA85J183_TRIRE|nr:unnamed protein product [Trichobilharzia regenti]
MADTISKRFNFNEAEISFKGYITWISIDISFMLFIMISVMVVIGSLEFLQSLLLGKAYLSIIFALLAMDLYCTALFFEKIRRSVLAVHILIGIVVLLLSVAYRCTYKQLVALIIFVTLNATLALSVCIIFVAVILKGLNCKGLLVFLLLIVFIAFVGILSLLFNHLPYPYNGLFMTANGLRWCFTFIDLVVCSAVNQAFFLWFFITLIFSAIY